MNTKYFENVRIYFYQIIFKTFRNIKLRIYTINLSQKYNRRIIFRKKITRNKKKMEKVKMRAKISNMVPIKICISAI